MPDETYELLRDITDAATADKLIEALGGMSVYVPKKSARAKKHADIYREYHDGAGYKALAIKYGYTESYIRKLVHQKGGDHGNQ